MKISHESLSKAYGYANLNEQGDKHKGNNNIIRDNSDNFRTHDIIEISGAKGAAILDRPNTYKNINGLDTSKMARFTRTTPEEATNQAESETVEATAYKANASTSQASAPPDTSDTFGLDSFRFRFAQKVAEAKMSNKIQEPDNGITYDNYDEEYEKTLNSVIEMMRGGTIITEGKSPAYTSQTIDSSVFNASGEDKADAVNINIAKVEADIRKELEKDLDFIEKNGLDFELVFKGRVYETISKMTGEDYMNISTDSFFKQDVVFGSLKLPFHIPDENNPGSHKAVDRDSDEAKAYINKLIVERGKANDEHTKYKELKAESSQVDM